MNLKQFYFFEGNESKQGIIAIFFAKKMREVGDPLVLLHVTMEGTIAR